MHGNLPALEAVLTDAAEYQPQAYWNLGDFLGYGPFVNEVVDKLFETCSAQVIGNYDLKVLKFPEKRDKWKKTKKKEKYLAFEWAREKLSDENVDKLAQLPQQDRQMIDGLSFLLTHGGPEAVDEAIGTQTPPERLKELAAMTDAKVILSGHTHIPFMKTIGETTFINPGSVGRPEGEDPRACYALLEIAPEGFHVRFQKVPYDLERLRRALHAAGLPEDFTKMFETGKNLDRVQEDRNVSVNIYRSDDERQIHHVRQFARQCRYEAEHSEQVYKLAILLFQKLRQIHHLESHSLYLLKCAAILHDIGWMQGQKAHHKTAMQMILGDHSLPFDENERKMIAIIARYHRKSRPQPDHAVYRDLPESGQKQVRLLGGLLRMADGLDRTHMSAIQDLDVICTQNRVEVRCRSRGYASAEMLVAKKKADLFEQTTGRKMRFIALKDQ